MTNLHLLVPSLFWHEISTPEIYSDLPLPALERLLAKSLHTDKPAQGLDAWLCNAFDVPKQQSWPIAPITLQADGAGLARAKNDYWLRADPVHLRIEQNHILLADSQVFKISVTESRQLADTLNQHFSKEGLIFLPLKTDRWYLRLSEKPDVQIHTLNEIAGKNINNFLPSGKDSMIWHSKLNEIQMLLHEHPVNLAREARDELVINGIWFWGGGVMSQSINSAYTRIWSDDVFSCALAQASGTDYTGLPLNAMLWQQSVIPGNHLVVLDALWRKAQYNDAHGWRESIKKLEQNWFAPLHIALKKGQINQLTLTAINENSSKCFTVTQKNLWKFWHMIKPFSNYMP